MGRDYSTFTIALYFSSSRGLMEFIQLGEPLVETNKKFFRFNFYSFTLLHILCELCKERALCTAYRKARSKAVLSRSSSSAQQQLEIMLNSASYLKLLSPFLHHLSSASHSFISTTFLFTSIVTFVLLRTQVPFT